MNKRLVYIDVAKFIGIFLVILAHCLERGNVRAYIYSFHLPLFFILNGITLRFKEDEKFGDYFVRKSKSYIIPMFFLGILILLAEALIKQYKGQMLSENYFLDGILLLVKQERAFPIWFVGALYIADLLFYVVWKVGKNKLPYMAILSTLFLALGIYLNITYRKRLPWNFDVATFGVFFIFFGYMFSHELLTKIRTFILDKRYISLIIGISLMAIGLAIAYINYDKYHLHLEMWAMQYEKYYLVIPAAIICSFGIIFISNAIRNKVLGELGKTTFVLLAFHQTWSMPIFSLIFPEWYRFFCSLASEDMNRYYYSLVETLFCFATILPIYYIIINTPFCVCLNKKMPAWLKNKLEKLQIKFSNLIKK